MRVGSLHPWKMSLSFGVLSLLHRAIRLKPSVEVSTRPDGLSSQLKGGGSALNKISELLLSLVS